MKKMLVTIQEFIDNGGILEKDRELYVNDSFAGYYLKWDDNFNIPLMYNGSYKSLPISKTFLVEIDVKPIYK